MATSPRPSTNSLVEVCNLGIRFGGIAALDDVSFSLGQGQITSLIGPNGAGKTTLFNCICRLYTPTQGDILFEGKSLLGLGAHRIAQLGIGRTFQNVALFPNLTVLQNVMVGAHSRSRSDYVRDLLGLPAVRRQEALLEEEARMLLQSLGLDSVALQVVSQLPFGTRKRIEIARALAGRPRLLLMDEPAGGLNHEEVHELGRLIVDLKVKRNITVLLVEHHIGLVMSVSDHVVALNFGSKLAEGTPAEIQRDPEVARAYLGEMET